jgi:hypothetical protein
MAGIFISYRREDSRADAGRLANDLKRHLGADQIFRDIDAIQPGMDFVKAIHAAVGACDALLAIIGPRWLSAKDEHGHPRLEDPNDYVRLEIEAALNRDITVIPVLVGGATMPRESELLAPLAPLARRQAHELSDSRWDYDTERLAAVLETIPGILKRRPSQPVSDAKAPAPTPSPTGGIGRQIAAGVIGAFGALMLFLSVVDAAVGGLSEGGLLIGALCCGLAYGLWPRRQT